MRIKEIMLCIPVMVAAASSMNFMNSNNDALQILSELLENEVTKYVLHTMMPKQNDCASWNFLTPIKDELDDSVEMCFSSWDMPWVQILSTLEYAEVFLACGYVIAVGPLHHQRNFQLPEYIKSAVRGVVGGAIHCPDGVLPPAGALLI